MGAVTKYHIDDAQYQHIKDAITRLQSSVNLVQVVNWLHNFEYGDWDMALELLGGLNFYSINQVIHDYDQGLKQILSKAGEDQKINVHGFGEKGKSGPTMMYFLLKTPTYLANKDRIKVLKDVNDLKNGKRMGEGSWLVLVDDVIGSGKTLRTFYSHNIASQLARYKFSLNLCVLCLAYMKESMPLTLQRIAGLQVFGSGYHRAFAPIGSAFGYRPSMLKMREFSHRYGKGLFNTQDHATGVWTDHPLGFNNSQSLLAFGHGIPNNTLPVFWSNKNEWVPLYPRLASAKISEIKQFKSENYFWLALTYKLNLFTQPEEQHGLLTSKLDLGMLALIRLKIRGSVPETIFQLMGITFYELQALLERGREKGLFDQDDNLTVKGAQLYGELQKKIQINKSEMKRKMTTFNRGVSYIPKTYNGLT